MRWQGVGILMSLLFSYNAEVRGANNSKKIVVTFFKEIFKNPRKNHKNLKKKIPKIPKKVSKIPRNLRKIMKKKS